MRQIVRRHPDRRRHLDRDRGSDVIGQLDHKRAPTLAWGGDPARVAAVGSGLQRRRPPGRAHHLQPEVAGLGIVRLPELHRLRTNGARHPHVSIAATLPGKVRHLLAVDGGPLPSPQRLVGIAAAQRMIRVRHVPQVLLPRELVEIELRRIRQEELVAAGVHDELRHVQPGPVEERILDVLQRLHLRRSQPVHDPVICIVAHRRGKEPIGLIVVQHRRLHVEDVDHDRADRRHPLVHDTRRPGRPAPLRSARHHEPLHRLPSALGAFRPGRRRIHRPHRRLRHRQSRRPPLITRP